MLDPFLLHLVAHGAFRLFRDKKPVEQGRTIKEVRCEQCGRSYRYELWRTAPTKEHLDWGLAEGIDLVPCPACGSYQGNMTPKARRQHGRWMLIAG